jgi:type IV pilus assembly protein PilQ
MKRKSMLLLVAAAIASPLAVPSVAQSTEPAAQPAPTVALSEKKDLISVDFPNEEIRTILRNVADLFELNLVVPETLQGRTSIKLRNVTWRQIFREVLEPIGYTVLEDENIIRVISRDTLAQEPTTTEVFILNYSRASEIMPTIATMVDTTDLVKGKIQVDARNNALVITERPTKLEKIRPIIAQLDVATSQVMIESKFIEVSNNDGKDVGMNWSSLKNFSVKQGKIDAEAMHAEIQDGKVTYTKGALYQPATLNVKPDSQVAQLQGSSDQDWKNSIQSLFNAPHLVTSTFSMSEFGTVMSLFESNSNARLVSNPTVVTLNNVEAAINIGLEYPIPSYSYNQERGNFEISGFVYKPIGINLKVTPQVNNAGFIKMNILPEVSSSTTSVSFGGASGATIPIISTRKVSTQVSLKNGHTLGIGGLIENQQTKGKTKVPFIGEIPVLGSLFKSDSNSLITRNLVIFITAKTLDSGEAKVDEVFSNELLNGVQVEKKDLPGARAPLPALSN